MIKFKKLDENAKAPTRAHNTDAGIDLYALEDVTVDSIPVYIWKYIKNWADKIFHIGFCASEPKDNHLCAKVKTGIGFEIPVGYFGKVFDRSSVGSKLLLVCAGVIDAAYRGDCTVCMYNLSFFSHQIKAGDKIAQMVVMPINCDELVEVDELDGSDRGEKGFGSSGK